MSRSRPQPASLRQHHVAVLAFEGVVPFDLATPCEVFGRTRLSDGTSPYVLRVCGTPQTVNAGAFQLKARYGFGAVADADTVLVPGIDDIDRPLPAALLQVIRAAVERGARVASLCSGAFILAAAGVLNGKRTTTHWLASAELARRYPQVSVDPNVLYVADGNVFSSAGAAACLDLCLHLVRRDFGSRVAAQAARCSVMPLEREGGQAQFITPVAPDPDAVHSLSKLLDWLDRNLAREHDLPSLARRAGMSTRSFNRHFKEQVGSTPGQWLRGRRVRRAQELLEGSHRSVEQIAFDTGFGAVASLREHFRRIVGTSPQAYRGAFRSGH
jgi:transcriptional regulator GlxA family with amidase domain